MQRITSGTEEAKSRHSRTWGPLGLMLSMAPAVIVIFAGIVSRGWGAISWLEAIVWGVLARVIFTLFSLMGKQWE